MTRAKEVTLETTTGRVPERPPLRLDNLSAEPADREAARIAARPRGSATVGFDSGPAPDCCQPRLEAMGTPLVTTAPVAAAPEPGKEVLSREEILKRLGQGLDAKGMDAVTSLINDLKRGNISEDEVKEALKRCLKKFAEEANCDRSAFATLFVGSEVLLKERKLYDAKVELLCSLLPLLMTEDAPVVDPAKIIESIRRAAVETGRQFFEPGVVNGYSEPPWSFLGSLFGFFGKKPAAPAPGGVERNTWVTTEHMPLGWTPEGFGGNPSPPPGSDPLSYRVESGLGTKSELDSTERAVRLTAEHEEVKHRKQLHEYVNYLLAEIFELRTALATGRDPDTMSSKLRPPEDVYVANKIERMEAEVQRTRMHRDYV